VYSFPQYPGDSCTKRVQVRLIRKHANQIDGVDVSTQSVGDIFTTTPESARLLIAEGWAVAVEQGRRTIAPARNPVAPIGDSE
jgi:hypothetical protein